MAPAFNASTITRPTNLRMTVLILFGGFRLERPESRKRRLGNGLRTFGVIGAALFWQNAHDRRRSEAQ